MLDMLRFITLVWALIFSVQGRVGVGDFLQSFVLNEAKPTMVVFNGICWRDSLKIHVMKELSKAGVRSSSLLPTGKSPQDNAVLLLSDLDCPGIAEVFDNTTRLNLHRLPYRWLALTSEPVSDAAALWNKFLVDSDLVVAAADGQGYTLTELYKPALDYPTILTPRGVFHGGLTDVRPHRELFRRRRDLMGAPLTMINVIQDSNSSKYHLLEETSLEPQYDYLAKNGWTLGKLGFLMLNATPRPLFGYRFGYMHNGKWNGIVKDLIDYKADMATNIGMTKLRLQAISYIDRMDDSRVRFIYRQPALSLTSNIFSLPFSSGVWMATAIATFIAGLAFYLSTKLTKNLRERDGGMADAFLLMISALGQQGCDVQPRNVSTRIILWVLFTCLMALYVAYAANIVVLLQASSNSVNNLAQLARSKLTLGAIDVDYNYFLFKDSSDPVRKDISRRILPENGPKPFYNLSEGVEKIRKGLFAFHSLVEPVYRQIEKTFQETEKCDLMEVDFIGYSGFHAPASKSTPYLELLRVAFKRLREVGLKAAVNLRYGARKPPCKESVAMFRSVGLMELRPVVLFMLYGVALSVAIAVGEHLVFHANLYHLRERRLTKQNNSKRLLARRN